MKYIFFSKLKGWEKIVLSVSGLLFLYLIGRFLIRFISWFIGICSTTDLVIMSILLIVAIWFVYVRRFIAYNASKEPTGGMP